MYLGFRQDADPAEFRLALQSSADTGQPLDADRFVHSLPAQKGGLYLIPNGTIHCSGVNNLVLEISATPYIFTFKMYDWVRRDLDGGMRPLNIDRAFKNLYFERRGDTVERDLVSHPLSLARGPDWTIVHLPTHPEHFYDVHRLEFSTSIGVAADNGCHVLNVVEGGPVCVVTGQRTMQVHFAETFVVPAAAGAYTLINNGAGMAKVVKAFVKA